MSLLGSLLGCKDGGAPIEASRIKSVRCSYGGGMTGGGESSELARQKDGTVTLVTSEREWHNSRERTVTYTLDEISTDYAYDYLGTVYYFPELEGESGMWEAFPTQNNIRFN